MSIFSLGMGSRAGSVRLLATALAWAIVAPATAQQVLPSSAEEDDTAEQEVVVTGVPPRCRPRAGDPQDLVDLSAAAGAREQQVIRIDPVTGRYALFPDDYPTDTRDEWQRDGTGLDKFVFRTPQDGSPGCIGTRSRGWNRFAQLRRAFPAHPLWGKYVILRASVAARNAGQVDMWIAAGAPTLPGKALANNIVAGGSKRVPLKGNHEWHKVSFLMGPVPCMANQVSYGITLRGGGDVWLSNPQFVEVPEASLSPSMRERFHGDAMLESDPICRHYEGTETLWRKDGEDFLPIAAGADLVVGVHLFRQVRADPDVPPNDSRRLGYEVVDYERSYAPGIIEF